MPKIFNILDKLKPAYDMAYKIILFICKILLVADIAITTFAVAGRFIPFISAPAWCEEIVLTLMSYMAVLSAALAIRRGAHIRMSVFDRYLSKKLILVLDILSDVALFILSYVMVTVGWKYAVQIGSKGAYSSMPGLSRLWMYLPVPVAGVAMFIFQLEVFYNHIKSFWAGQVGTDSEVSTTNEVSEGSTI